MFFLYNICYFTATETSCVYMLHVYMFTLCYNNIVQMSDVFYTYLLFSTYTYILACLRDNENVNKSLAYLINSIKMLPWTIVWL